MCSVHQSYLSYGILFLCNLFVSSNCRTLQQPLKYLFWNQDLGSRWAPSYWDVTASRPLQGTELRSFTVTIPRPPTSVQLQRLLSQLSTIHIFPPSFHSWGPWLEHVVMSPLSVLILLICILSLFSWLIWLRTYQFIWSQRIIFCLLCYKGTDKDEKEHVASCSGM